MIHKFIVVEICKSFISRLKTQEQKPVLQVYLIMIKKKKETMIGKEHLGTGIIKKNTKK